MYSNNDLKHLLSILGKGKSNVKRAGTIENELHAKFGFPKSGNQVKARGLITYAIQQGHLIKSSTRNPAGYWLENDKKEMEKNIASLRRRAKKIVERANNLQRNIK